jgi:hypothetical protein
VLTKRGFPAKWAKTFHRAKRLLGSETWHEEGSIRTDLRREHFIWG